MDDHDSHSILTEQVISIGARYIYFHAKRHSADLARVAISAFGNENHRRTTPAAFVEGQGSHANDLKQGLGLVDWASALEWKSSGIQDAVGIGRMCFRHRGDLSIRVRGWW